MKKTQYDYLIFDTSSLFHKLYHGYREQEAKGKQPLYNQVNGQETYLSTIKGYFLSMINFRKVFPNAKFIHVLDPVSLENNYRKKLDPSYKSDRVEKDQELISQLQLLPTILKCFGEVYYQDADFEADDLISSLAYKLSQEEKKCIIYSRDKDLLQTMYNEHVHIMDGMLPVKDRQGKIIDYEPFIFDNVSAVVSKIGVYPHQIPDFLALTGDDGISGFPKLGKETAKKIIQQYGGLADFLDNIDRLVDLPRVNNHLLKDLFSNKENVAKLANNFNIVKTVHSLDLMDLEEKIALSKKNFNTNHFNRALQLLSMDEKSILNIQPQIITNHQTNNNYNDKPKGYSR